MTSGAPNRQHVTVAVAVAVAVVAAVVLVSFGFPSWILLFIAPVPWMLVLGRKSGIAFAVCATGIASLFLLLFLLMITTAIRAPLMPAVISVWAVVGAAGVVFAWRNPVQLTRPSSVGLATWLPSLLGALLWLGTLAATAIVPGASRLSWTMLGDSANNIIFAREIIYRGGIGLGAASNPVPLPSALMAVVMGSGRSGVSPAQLAEHDVAAFAQVWGLIIAMLCVLAGATAAVIARRAGARPLLLAIVSAGASLVPLSWFVTGYPIDYGFFNTHVALVILLASFVAYLADPRRVAVALVVQLGSCTLLLSVWSPLVLLPGMLAVAIVVRRSKEVRALRRGQLSLLLVAIAQLIAYVLLVAIPGLLLQSSFLTAAGGAFPFRKWLIVLLALAAVVLAVVIFRRLKDPLVVGVLALTIGLAIGLGALLFITRSSPDPWTYYPLKFAWLGVVILVIVVIGLGAAFLARYFKYSWMRALGVIIIASCATGFLLWAPTSSPGFRVIDPLPKLLTGQVLGQGDKVADQIFELSNPEQANFLWKTPEKFEGSVNFWVLQLWSNSMSKNLELKRMAYGLYDANKTSSLCRIVTLLGGRVTVHTGDHNLAAELNSTCPATSRGVTIVGLP
jgi:hypothetical protein